MRSTSGEVLGRHAGVHRFTVGQRRGLGVTGPEPRYVVGIDVAAGRVVVGSSEEASRQRFEVREVNWISGRPPLRPVEGETAADAARQRRGCFAVHKNQLQAGGQLDPVPILQRARPGHPLAVDEDAIAAAGIF